MGEPIVIRAPTAGDAPALSQLVGELGYPSEAADIPRRLTALQNHPGVLTLVAELHGRVVGAKR